MTRDRKDKEGKGREEETGKIRKEKRENKGGEECKGEV